ncbi:hypothetical protein [Vibrio cincinnatiensis]|uniref:hypothetical protein n=1 Tax=Vibrio cincinnatiensis TaxID=675 RepID=UPI001EDE3CCE|nr:hypothetical protein [Vibrio cincinnatiensis]MCG3733672.1 hypothetical protein [Vibrio cincinnatiensis]
MITSTVNGASAAHGRYTQNNLFEIISEAEALEFLETEYQLADREPLRLLHALSPVVLLKRDFIIGLYRDDYGLPQQVTNHTFKNYQGVMAGIGALVDQIVFKHTQPTG